MDAGGAKMSRNEGKTPKLRYKVLVIIAAFVLMSAAGAWAILTMTQSQRAQSMQNAAHLMEGETNKLKYAIESRILTADALEMSIVHNNSYEQNFEYAAKRLYKDDNSLRSIQLAPNGVVEYVYPKSGNEYAYTDLFADPDKKRAAQWARDTGVMALDGPYEENGVSVLAARKPVYVDNGAGEKVFWGFSIVVLDMEALFKNADLELMSEQGYNYRLSRTNPLTGVQELIKENNSTDMDGYIRGIIKVANGKWRLDIIPKEGWVSKKRLYNEIGLTAVIIILATMALYGILTVLEQKKKLEYQNITDSLTGIRNGRYFSEKVRSLSINKAEFAIFYLDMNNFKQINDSCGHDTGDRILQTVAKRVCDCIEDGMIAARVGGDEFTVLIPRKCSNAYCEELKAKLKQEVSRPCEISGREFSPEISIGYACCPVDGDKAESVIHLADQRMYAEKRESKICS